MRNGKWTQVCVRMRVIQDRDQWRALVDKVMNPWVP